MKIFKKKKKKEVKVNYYYVVLIISLFFFFLISQKYIGAKLCENMRNEKFKSYIKGKIIVNFKEGINNEEAMKIIKQYDLNYDNQEWSNMLFVNVPKGDELKWTCRIEQNNKIRNSNLITK